MSGPDIQSDSTGQTVSRAGRAAGRNTLQKVCQLEQRVVSLERERSSQLYSRRHEFRKVFCSLEDTEIKLNQERKAERKELSQQISRIKSNVQGFKKMLEDMRPGPTFMERLKQVLEETEASVLAFKDKQREVYEGLLVEERQVSQEVMAFQKRLEAWAATTGSQTAEHSAGGPPASVAGERGGGREGDAALPPAVLAFERFLRQTGGTRGGWDNYDHNTFQHLTTKHSNESVFMEAALRELPTRTEVEVRAHCAWYTEYCALLEAKRVAIQQWKKNRQVVRSQQLKAGATKEKDRESRRREDAAEREKREQERQLYKDKLQAWKVQQEKKRQEAEEARLKKETVRAKKQERETIQQAAMREEVRQYQEARERERQTVAEVEQQRRLAQEREHQLQAKREIGKFRERDMRAVAERKERDRQKELAMAEQKMRLDKLKEQVAVNVARDPERVLRPTSGWRERKKAREREMEEEGGLRGTSVGVGARELPRRAVPAWRQGL